ncbi:Aste57867_2709 [Aphanomyces stellatus]|uniref:Aste57867_2709 protein n=1 Tax=Aphanomyces stellatus TaxID=120398 RepID=A0A485KDU5_9STRA|nr:hypothetical protein As57867_002702 [Aphanomyces stellatus]VFT79902.1 Aste57867_2709 [Aphanomyces stellatus]
MATASDESTDLAQVQTLSLFQGGETNTSIENAAAHATQTVGQAHVNLELAQTMDLSEANPRHNFVDKSNCDVVSSLEPKKDVRPQYRRPAPVESKAPPLHPLEAPRTTALSAVEPTIEHKKPTALEHLFGTKQSKKASQRRSLVGELPKKAKIIIGGIDAVDTIGSIARYIELLGFGQRTYIVASVCINTPNDLQCSAHARRIKCSHCASPRLTPPTQWTLYGHS